MRKHLIWVLGLTGLAVAFIGATIAQGVTNTQTITGSVAPKKLPKKTRAPVGVNIDVASTNSGNANNIPNPTTLALVDFDKDIKFQQKGLPTCDPTQFTAATTTQQAKDACSDALIGGGLSKIQVPSTTGGPPINIDATATAFNGAHNTVVLFTYNSLSGAQALIGQLGKDSAAGSAYGTTLTTPVPKLAGGSAVIQDFQTKVKKVYNHRGKKLSVVNASCKDKKIKFQARFTDDKGNTAVATSTQKCKQKSSHH
jgi:hypothetical protein